MHKKWWLLAPFAILLALQAFPVNRKLPVSNASEEFHHVANPPGPVMRLFKHACYDCHSNNTRYPWYSGIQPVGWWIEGHIKTGRGELNLSEFGRWSAEDQADILRHCAKLISKEAMPLGSYRWLHPEARLTAEQKKLLTDWLLERADNWEQIPATAAGRIVPTAPSDTCDDNDANPRCCFIGMPENIGSVVKIAPDDEPGRRIAIRGQFYKPDGRTPYPDVLIYAYHTDNTGRYSRSGKERGIFRWHGRLHGWCRTDKEGRYELQTIRPAAYPGGGAPEHIHIVVWEPGSGKEPYYLPDFLFADDLLLPARDREAARKQPGKTGVVTLVARAEGVLEGSRNIVLK
ncbi:MAG: heme-binding domain-containing protein [Saprospirales bacterium]|nr:heme-binding domain-containing protein [Saprospirales bacterium]MBK8920818.1 heme-binding domain-containing protein [Saprospirales bacterium]